MVALRSIRSRVAASVRRFIRSPLSSPLGNNPHSAPTTSRTLFFWPSSKRCHTEDTTSHSSHTLTVSTPDSSRSVSFEDSITWPFIDDEI
uniref:Uncharacterized protein n=1 Tax=Panagrolaimus sp. JU765 TaxID=591449 RepID=A0AC34RAF2_9BILA